MGVYDGRTWALLRVQEGHTDDVNCVDVSAELIVSGSADDTARVWAAADGALRHTLRHPDDVRAVALAERALATGCDDKLVRLFDLQTGQLTRELRGHTDRVLCVAWGDGVLLSGARDQTVRVWAADAAAAGAQDACVASLTGHSGPVRGVALSAAGGFVASMSWKEVITWAPAAGA